MSDNRPCTCHPDDNPPQPCAERYALSECQAAAMKRMPPRFGSYPETGGQLIKSTYGGYVFMCFPSKFGITAEQARG